VRTFLCLKFYALVTLNNSGGPHKRENLLFELQCNEINLWHRGLLIYP